MWTSISEIPSGVTIQELSGPLLIGSMLNWGFYGVLCVQAYLYFKAFPNDKLSVKCLVLWVLLIETIQCLFVMHDAFAMYARGYGDVTFLNDVPFLWLSVPMLTGVVSCTVQLFFAYRISVVSGIKIMGALVSVFALLEGITAIIVGVKLKQIVAFPRFYAVAYKSKTIWMISTTFCDILIASLMTFFLYRKKSTFRETQVLVKKLIRLIIETGAITALMTTLDIVIFLKFPHNNYHTVPCLIMSKVYSNTALVILNSRMHISTGSSADSAGLSSMSFVQPTASVGDRISRSLRVFSPTPPTVPVVSVTVETNTDRQTSAYSPSYRIGEFPKPKDDSHSEEYMESLSEKPENMA